MYKQGEVYSITYDVWINGEKIGLEKKQCIESIEITETVVESDSATITIYDPDFEFIEDNIFVEDVPIKIKLGWSDTTYRQTFEGYISFIDIEFNSDGMPKLEIICMDNTHKMNREKKEATFENMTSAEVVQQIVASYGFKCVIDSSYTFTKQETITQSDQTDIDFLVQLASDEVYPFTARLVGDTFYYEKMGNLGDPSMELMYRQYPHDIKSLSLKINTETRQDSTSSSGVDGSSGSYTSALGEWLYETATQASFALPKADTSNYGYVYDPSTGTWSYRNQNYALTKKASTKEADRNKILAVFVASEKSTNYLYRTSGIMPKAQRTAMQNYINTGNLQYLYNASTNLKVFKSKVSSGTVLNSATGEILTNATVGYNTNSNTQSFSTKTFDSNGKIVKSGRTGKF